MALAWAGFLVGVGAVSEHSKEESCWPRNLQYELSESFVFSDLARA